MTRRQSRWVLAGIVVLYTVLGTIYSVTTPVFEAPDESHHFFVVKHIVEHCALPVQRAETRGLWEQEGSQPPLYYVVGALLVHVSCPATSARHLILGHALAPLIGALLLTWPFRVALKRVADL